MTTQPQGTDLRRRRSSLSDTIGHCSRQAFKKKEYLEKSFGKDYRRYRDRVGRYFLRIQPPSPIAMRRRLDPRLWSRRVL